MSLENIRELANNAEIILKEVTSRTSSPVLIKFMADTISSQSMSNDMVLAVNKLDASVKKLEQAVKTLAPTAS